MEARTYRRVNDEETIQKFLLQRGIITALQTQLCYMRKRVSHRRNRWLET